MLYYGFDDYQDLSKSEHYQLSQILDNATDDYEQDYEDFLSFEMEL